MSIKAFTIELLNHNKLNINITREGLDVQNILNQILQNKSCIEQVSIKGEPIEYATGFSTLMDKYYYNINDSTIELNLMSNSKDYKGYDISGGIEIILKDEYIEYFKDNIFVKLDNDEEVSITSYLDLTSITYNVVKNSQYLTKTVKLYKIQIDDNIRILLKRYIHKENINNSDLFIFIIEYRYNNWYGKTSYKI